MNGQENKGQSQPPTKEEGKPWFNHYKQLHGKKRAGPRH